MSIYAPLFQLFADQGQARTDAEIAAQIMRMAFMAPYLGKEIGLRKAQYLLEVLRQTSPTPAAFAQAYQQQVLPLVRRFGLESIFPASIPVPEVRTVGELPTLAPEASQRIEQIVGPQIDALLEARGISEAFRPRVRDVVMRMVRAQPVQLLRTDPSGQLTVDPTLLGSVLEGLARQVPELVSRVPAMASLREYLDQTGNKALVAWLEKYPLTRIVLGAPIDLSNPQPHLSLVQEQLRASGASVLQSIDAAIAAFQTTQSAKTFKGVKEALDAARDAVRLGLITPDQIAAREAHIAAIKDQSVPVVLPDGRRIGLAADRALPYLEARSRQVAQMEAVPAAQALAENPNDPQRRAQWSRVIAKAQREGLDMVPIMQAAFADARRQKALFELEAAQRRASIAASLAALRASNLEIRERELALAERQLRDAILGKIVRGEPLGDGEATVAAAFFNLTPPGIDIASYRNGQKEFTEQHEQVLASATQALASGNRDAFLTAIQAFKQTWGATAALVLEAGRTLTSPSRWHAIADVQGSLPSWRSRDLRLLILGNQRGWISPQEAGDFLKMWRITLAQLYKQEMITPHQLDAMDQAFRSAAQQLRAPDPAPSGWERFIQFIKRAYRTGKAIDVRSVGSYVQQAYQTGNILGRP